MIVFAVTLFPHPDSPTIASVSPLYSSNDTPRSAWTSPPNVLNETCNSSQLAPFRLKQLFGSCPSVCLNLPADYKQALSHYPIDVHSKPITPSVSDRVHLAYRHQER